MLEIKNVNSGYEKNTVLSDVSACFEKGKLITVIGPNGSGKSTLLKTVVGIVQPTSGEIIADSEPLNRLSQKDIAKRIAYLAQGKGTPDMTVEQMVLHGRFPHLGYPRRYTAKDREAAFSAMKKTGIVDLAEKNLTSLSGGMRQNAYIAMALAQDTDYILLDEPTTYLDISHQIALMKTLRSLANGGKGIAAVLHDLPLAFTFSDGIIVIDGGRIISSGTPQEIYRSDIIGRVFGVGLDFNSDTGEYSYRFFGEKINKNT